MRSEARSKENAKKRVAWLRLTLGLISLGLGFWLIVRPFSSLSLLVLVIAAGLVVTGLTRLADNDRARGSRALGALWIIVAVMVLVWPGPTVRWLTLIVGVHLVVEGLGDIWDGIRAQTDQRFASLVKGLATVIFGVLALAWPDITVLVVAVVFAARLIIFGITQIVAAFRHTAAAVEPPGRLRRWLNVVGAVAALAIAVGLALISSALNDGTPIVDDFYAAPDQVPEEAGVLIRHEPFDRGIPDDAVAWRILYTTTRDEGQPAVASAIVVAPAAETAGAREVIAWAHGTTGVHQTCAPSVLEGTFSTGAFFSVEEVVDEGWVLVATDYVGLGTESPHPYLIGQGEGRSVLDAVRAARELEELILAERTVVWGHSQGGHAALWTGVLAPSYAPDVGVIGVAALAPASDLQGMMDTLQNVTGGSIFASFALSAYSDAYDDVDLGDYVVPGGDITVRQIARRCLAEPSVLTSILSSVAVSFSKFEDNFDSGPLADRFAENKPPYEIEVPLLLAQGGEDTLVTPEMQDVYVEGLCAAGRDVDYRTYEGLSHVPLVEADSPLLPDLFEWTRARLAGKTPLSTC